MEYRELQFSNCKGFYAFLEYLQYLAVTTKGNVIYWDILISKKVSNLTGRTVCNY